MTTTDDGAWFAPKRIGYGAGLPVAWQGWAVYGVYCAIVIAAATLIPAWSMLVVVPATIVLIAVCARRTRGGWRWRGGR